MLQENDTKARILIVEDEESITKVLNQLLGESYQCATAASAEEALILLRTESFNLVLSDINMPGISGLELVPQILELAPDTIIVLISGERNIENALRAMRNGAFDYITKPFTLDLIEAVVNRALDHQKLRLIKRNYENHLEELVSLRTRELHNQISARQRIEEKVSRMAYYEPLTGLPNSTLFRDRMTHELIASNALQKKTAAVFLALDQFKKINDTLGHEIGDELLRSFTHRLKEFISLSDTPAYFGGGEFALLLTGISSTEDAAKTINKIKKALLPPFYCGGHELYITTSIGISVSPNDSQHCQTLLQNAGTALYRARQQGGDNIQFFTNDMQSLAIKSLALENTLHSALERNEFVVHYQPKIDVRSGVFFGSEALVRWQHPTFGIVPPNDFIPIAEETGLIVALGEWVLRTACRQTAAWQRSGFSDLCVSVNLSQRQFRQENLFEMIEKALDESKLDARYLELEITESSLMNDTSQAIVMLRLLKQLGIKISLDDFGTGYSCLSYLKTLPLDIIKIDRAFVQNITTDLKDEAIVKTIITLAENLELKTIAEGVETSEQANVLSRLGCHNFQGYFFGKPVLASDFEILMIKQKSKLLELS